MQRLCTETSRSYPGSSPGQALGRSVWQAIAEVSQKQWESLLNRMIGASRQATGCGRANRVASETKAVERRRVIVAVIGQKSAEAIVAATPFHEKGCCEGPNMKRKGAVADSIPTLSPTG